MFDIGNAGVDVGNAVLCVGDAVVDVGNPAFMLEVLCCMFEVLCLMLKMLGCVMILQQSGTKMHLCAINAVAWNDWTGMLGVM